MLVELEKLRESPYSLLLAYPRPDPRILEERISAVSYTHLTLPTTERV